MENRRVAYRRRSRYRRGWPWKQWRHQRLCELAENEVRPTPALEGVSVHSTPKTEVGVPGATFQNGPYCLPHLHRTDEADVPARAKSRGQDVVVYDRTLLGRLEASQARAC
eukprot:scaffold53114_cov42-Prasinocladus_malaysianus.AAC.2